MNGGFGGERGTAETMRGVEEHDGIEVLKKEKEQKVIEAMLACSRKENIWVWVRCSKKGRNEASADWMNPARSNHAAGTEGAGEGEADEADEEEDGTEEATSN